MTVQSTSVQTSHVANGIVTTFTYQFKLQEASDLVVQVQDLLGVFHTLTLNADYTVDPLGIGLDAGGNILSVTYLGLVIQNGWTVWMTRVMALTQDTDLANQGTYLPETVEGEFDAVVMMQQGQDFQLQRTIRGLLTDSAMPVLPAALSRLGMWLQFDPLTGMPNAVPGAPVVLKDNFAANTAPTTANDSTQGYAEGSRWFDTTHNLVYICMSAAVGAAVWVQLVFKNNLTAVVAPAVGNDSTQGYSVGSMWLNTATNILYVCISAAPGAAVWAAEASPTNTTSPVNSFVDPCCRVAQGDGTTTLTTAYKYGLVDLVQCKGAGTAVSAGTITQDAAFTVAGAATAYSCKIAGATITGVGKVFFRRWIESRDAVALKNKTVFFSVLGFQDTGGAINGFLQINKATVQDNFGGVTAIGTGGTVSLPNNITTAITAAIAMGDCSNGVEIILEMDCGAVTTKDFYATDWQVSLSTISQACQVPQFANDYDNVMRYFEKSYEYGTAPGTATINGMNEIQLGGSIVTAADIRGLGPRFRSEKLVTPTMTIYSPSTGASGKVFAVVAAADKVVTTLAYKSSCIIVNNSGTTLADGEIPQDHWTADARL